MNPGHVMLGQGYCQRLMSRSVRRLERLVLYKDMKIFGYAANGAGGCGNHELHLHVGLGGHVHTEGLRGGYAYGLKYEVVRLEARRAV